MMFLLRLFIRDIKLHNLKNGKCCIIIGILMHDDGDDQDKSEPTQQLKLDLYEHCAPSIKQK